MPELPEVETVKNILNTFLINAKIKKVEVFKNGIIVGSVGDFIHKLEGRTFKEVKRRGKYLIFTFDNDLIMLSHLRMEGKYIEVQPGEKLSRYAHVVFYLEDGRTLCYDDSRQFGKIELSTRNHYLETKAMKNVGEEPYNIEIDDFYGYLQKKATPIKLSLLDQKIMSGLGNIYADEVLFLSKIHPLTPSNLISRSQSEMLINNSIIVLDKAIKAGGTTIRSYMPAHGVTGHFQQELFAYGREGKKCVTCGGLMKKIFVGGRGTTYCPSCQVNPASPRLVAITGQKAAGKSVIRRFLEEEGQTVYDADSMAKNLYHDMSVVKMLESLFETNLTNKGKFDINLLRSLLLENPAKIKDLNNIIHPLVKDEIMKIIKNTSAKIVYFEIPLVFSRRINELFDFIVGIEVSRQKQDENLSLRGEKLGINPDEAYMKNRHRVDYIIINDGSIDNLINKFEQFRAKFQLK